MAKKVPEHVAFRLAQKAKDADKKIKEAEKKVKLAEKKAKEADKKIKAAEKKAKEAEEKAREVVQELDHDDLDDLDDFDDFDDLDDLDDFDVIEDEKTDEEDQQSESDDSELEELMKQASSSESSEEKIHRANQMVGEGNFDGALEIWKSLTSSDADNPENWRGLASVLDSRNQEGDSQKAQTARDHASRIETNVIANKTGRKMEDIVADLMDDGILNFSAGSDAKE